MKLLHTHRARLLMLEESGEEDVVGSTFASKVGDTLHFRFGGGFCGNSTALFRCSGAGLLYRSSEGGSFCCNSAGLLHRRRAGCLIYSSGVGLFYHSGAGLSYSSVYLFFSSGPGHSHVFFGGSPIFIAGRLDRKLFLRSVGQGSGGVLVAGGSRIFLLRFICTAESCLSFMSDNDAVKLFWLVVVIVAGLRLFGSVNIILLMIFEHFAYPIIISIGINILRRGNQLG